MVRDIRSGTVIKTMLQFIMRKRVTKRTTPTIEKNVPSDDVILVMTMTRVFLNRKLGRKDAALIRFAADEWFRCCTWDGERRAEFLKENRGVISETLYICREVAKGNQPMGNAQVLFSQLTAWADHIDEADPKRNQVFSLISNLFADKEE